MADSTRRVFFALWPDAPARAMIAGLAREVALESGGRPTALNHIHLTLAFVGEQPAIRVDSLRRLAGAVRARAFMLALDEIGGFRRTGIAWLGSSTAQPELAALHDDLTRALQSRGFPVEEQYDRDRSPLGAADTLARELVYPDGVRAGFGRASVPDDRRVAAGDGLSAALAAPKKRAAVRFLSQAKPRRLRGNGKSSLRSCVGSWRDSRQPRATLFAVAHRALAHYLSLGKRGGRRKAGLPRCV